LDILGNQDWFTLPLWLQDCKAKVRQQVDNVYATVQRLVLHWQDPGTDR
jgi:hypothetical protein